MSVTTLSINGRMVSASEGATILDFAFSIHSDVGCACRTAKVNNLPVSIHYRLKNGDQPDNAADNIEQAGDNAADAAHDATDGNPATTP